MAGDFFADSGISVSARRPLAVIPSALTDGFRPRSTPETRTATPAVRPEERCGIADTLTAWKCDHLPFHVRW
ncbi:MULTISPECIES: hypothetical protein [unclassified Streptomyces]|uniref:hypothetical protein n=1 Tax=unclassified Streptomyces TaxID=2593676 RepID=UPI0033321281